MFLLLTRYHYWLDNIRDNRNMCDLYIYYKRGGSGCLRTDPGCLYEMGFQTFVACIAGSPGLFLWRVSFHSDPDFLPRNISKHPETS